MPTYSTPDPIDLAVKWQVGGIDVIASDRVDTVVTVSPTNASKALDRRAAEETEVRFDGGRLTVIAPRPRFSVIGPGESVDLTVELPAGSRFTAEVAMGGVRTTGRLGATRIKSSMGVVELESTGDLWLRAGHGNAVIGTADGNVEATADHGQLRIGTVTGDGALKASHGSITVGEAGGDVDAKLSYGDLMITRALGSVTAKTAYGTLELREVSSGSIDVESGFGAVEIGVRAGVPVWLDLSTKDGRVRNRLDGHQAPDESEEAVAIRARTRSSDITVHRAR